MTMLPCSAMAHMSRRFISILLHLLSLLLPLEATTIWNVFQLVITIWNVFRYTDIFWKSYRFWELFRKRYNLGDKRTSIPYSCDSNSMLRCVTAIVSVLFSMGNVDVEAVYEIRTIY